jgi:hypothetical protein
VAAANFAAPLALARSLPKSVEVGGRSGTTLPTQAGTYAAELAREARARAEEALEAATEAAEHGIDDAHRYLKRQQRDRLLAVAATAARVGLPTGLLLGNRRTSSDPDA